MDEMVEDENVSRWVPQPPLYRVRGQGICKAVGSPDRRVVSPRECQLTWLASYAVLRYTSEHGCHHGLVSTSRYGMAWCYSVRVWGVPVVMRLVLTLPHSLPGSRPWRSSRRSMPPRWRLSTPYGSASASVRRRSLTPTVSPLPPLLVGNPLVGVRGIRGI
jgi:hypothetical protein